MITLKRITGLEHRISAQHGRLTAYTVGDNFSPNQSLKPIAELMALRKRMGRQRLAQPCAVDNKTTAFVKTTSIDSYPSRLRISLGLKRRSGAYDWPLAELRNNVKASKRTDLIPTITGIGFARGRLGLVQEVFLSFENLVGYVNGLEWMKKHPEKLESFILTGLNSIRALNALGIYHLDLWAGNIMVPAGSLNSPKVIDLENCFIGTTAYHNETLGYQLGLFYQHSLGRLTTEAYYDAIVMNHIRGRSESDNEQFLSFYQFYKHNSASRKERFLIPLRGWRAAKPKPKL